MDRYRRQVELGLVPDDLTLPVAQGPRNWESLSETDRRVLAKKMAVFSGMLDAADEEVGRFRDYLRQIGQLENTAFIVMSDNGADAYDLSQLNVPFRL
jgi:arylsulfatase A-like enzyme